MTRLQKWQMRYPQCRLLPICHLTSIIRKTHFGTLHLPHILALPVLSHPHKLPRTLLSSLWKHSSWPMPGKSLPLRRIRSVLAMKTNPRNRKLELRRWNIKRLTKCMYRIQPDLVRANIIQLGQKGVQVSSSRVIDNT